MAEPFGARRSPLADDAIALGGTAERTSGALRIAGVAFLTQVDVRLDPSDSASMVAVLAAVGVAVPPEPNTVGTIDGRAILWLGPDEWLVIGPPSDADRLPVLLREALAGRPRTAVVDVSAGRTTLELAGPGARPLLQKGCSIDLHPRAFGPGRCAQTLLARVQVVIWQTSPEPAYRVLVRPSFAGYLAAWLLDAAEEFTRG